jgi:hypothetical protein
MSQVKRLKEMGIEFDDPKIWDLLHDLGHLPEYLAEKERKRLEREKFVESVFGEALKYVKATQEN